MIVFGLCGCAASPQQQLKQEGYDAQIDNGKGFLHLIIREAGPGSLLHVYLEGDGRPWLSPARISLDPTPRNPVMLKLFALDDAPSLYLGRPCYWRLGDPGCNPQWWTSRRYAPEVVTSLNEVIDAQLGDLEGVALFGHSGGGTLAMLLAARRDDVKVVVTLAGNLDTEAWTQTHGYSKLSGSLNPAREAPLPSSIDQYHFLGGQDDIITSEMISATIARQGGADLIVIDSFDHSCCWEQIWPGLLDSLEIRALQ